MKRWILAGGAILLVGGGIAAFLLVEFEPRTPAEALARAEKALDRFSRRTGLGPDDRKREQDAILGRFRWIASKWPQAPERAAGACRAAELLRQWGRIEEALAAFRDLGTADGAWTAADIADRDLGKADDALALWRKFAETHRNDPRSDAAAWRVIELMAAAGDDRFAPADLLEAARAFLAERPASAFRDRAMLLIAGTLQRVKEHEASLREYDRIIQEFEGKPAAAKALLEKGKILAEKLDKKKEAAETLKELEKKHPDTPEAREGRGMRERAERGAGEEEAARKEDEFFRERYGMPGGDLSRLALLTPRDYLRDLIEQKIDIVHIDLRLEIDAAAKSFSAAADYRLKNLGPARTALRFVLDDFCTVSKVALGTAACESDRKDLRLLVRLPSPLAEGAEATLRFEWTGTQGPPTTPMRLGESGYAAPGAVWYPFTLFGDLHTATVTAKAPGVFRATATDSPALGIFFAYGPYETAAKGRVKYLTAKAGDKRVAGVVDAAADILAYYEREFGAIPLAELALADADLPVGLGGISPRGLIFLNRAFFETTPDPVSLLAHEIAHQWWGNHVPVSFAGRDWAPWLSEGLASHSDAMYLAHRFGPERAGHHIRNGAFLYIERVLHSTDQPLAACWTGASYPAIVYMKGAAVLDMLREELGPAYPAGLRRYAREAAGRESGVSDLRLAMEAESKRDLRDWFAQWAEGPGFPRLKVAVEGAELVIRQESKRLFRLDLDVEIDGKIERRTIEKAEHRFPLGSSPKKVVLDPGHRILKAPGPGNEWVAP